MRREDHRHGSHQRLKALTFLIAAGVAAVPFAGGTRRAEAQPMMGGGGGMPDLRVINGKPLPDRGMAAGTVTVRVARKMPVNAVADVEVTALIKNAGGELKKRTAKTDSSGRAIFEAVGAGQRFEAEVTVDGEKLKTSSFEVPADGGVRTMLIAGLGPAPAGGGEGAGEGAGDGGGEGEGEHFAIGVSAGTAEPVASLPDKTLEVRALDEKGKPLANQKVTLGMVSQGGGGKIKVLRATTGADGVAKFEGLATGPGTGYAAVVDVRGMRLGTRPFLMPDKGGARAEIRVLERTSDPSVVAIGSGGKVVLQMQEEVLQVLEILPLENRSTKIFDPGAGALEIPLPKGFVSAQAGEGDRKIDVRKNYGVAVHGAVAPTPAPETAPAGNPANEVRFLFIVPYHGSSTYEFAQPLPNGLGATTLITEQADGITLEGPGIGPRESRELGGRKYWVTGLSGVSPGGVLAFTVKGLPSTDNSGRIASGALALLLVASAFIFGRRPADTRKAAGNERQKLLERREKLFGELLRAERDRRVEAAGGGGRAAAVEASKERRGQLVAKLETVYRELAALDESRAA